jgi:hypothetical protein
MGGLLVADSVYEFIHTRPDTDAPLWPNVVACLAFDTPVLPLSSAGISALLIKHLEVSGSPPSCLQKLCYKSS